MTEIRIQDIQPLQQKIISGFRKKAKRISNVSSPIGRIGSGRNKSWLRRQYAKTKKANKKTTDRNVKRNF